MPLVFLFASLALIAGCVSHVPMSTEYEGPRELPIAIVDRFESDAVILTTLDEEFGDEHARPWRGFTVRDVTLPSNAEEESSIQFEYYDVDGDDPTPVVILLPIFDGRPIVTRYFARYFASQGWAALTLDRDRDLLENIAEPEQAIRANMLEYRRVLDWVAQQPEIDSGSIGLFGISFGAMDAVMLAALDDRIDALVVAMAGGDLAYLFMNTNYRPVARTVNGMLEATGLTRAALLEALEKRFATNPLMMGPYVDAQRVLMILTRTDAIVPFEAQQALRTSLGTPETLYLPTGHRTSIVYFPLLRASAHEFFARQFGAAPLSTN
jgi:dienelactone hydrolase